jgi:hypothetical protein
MVTASPIKKSVTRIHADETNTNPLTLRANQSVHRVAILTLSGTP